ncbi:PAS domain-containing protein [Trichormus sp. NMC-1]|uniref:PAS domain-containing sensor histidine kinase n=1 Tax=Trichormus sp. NMC-1 TaxID=1853259 RepID=UPI0008DC2180|nr:PAS domain-containing protein [Trichormus sp. NMC-1]
MLGIAILLACPEGGWMKVVMSPYLGGVIIRSLLPIIIGAPILNAALLMLASENNLLLPEAGFVIRVIVNIFMLGGVSWWNAKYLNVIDQKQQEYQQALKEANENLEARVKTRTAQLETANNALKKSQINLANLINTLPGIAFSRDGNVNWAMQDVSDGCLAVTGYSKEELCSLEGCTFPDLIMVEDLPKIAEAIQTAIADNIFYQVEYRIHSKLGEEKWLWEKGLGIAIDGQIQTIQGFITEITSLKQTQEALRESESKFRELAENIHEVFHINSADLSEMLYVSPGYEEIWGQSCESLYRNPASWHESIHPEDSDRILAACARLIQGEPLQEEYRIIRARGEIRWIFARVFPIYSQSGEILRHVGIAANITERKQAEQKIWELNQQLEMRVQQRTAELTAANKELESFSYSVSHDLRSPLRGIDGFSKALLERYQDQLDDKGKHYLNRIRSGTQRMGELIDDLLQLSRVTRSQMRPTQVNLSAIAQEIAQELSQNHPERLVNWLISPDLIVSGDRQLLRIILENLLNNAWKFTSVKIQADIELGCMQCQENDGSSLAYFVRDNGVGFDAFYANKLFQPFQRLHTVEEFPGTGIGLATVQRIVRRHGGDVWAEGLVGEGATFYFTLHP